HIGFDANLIDSRSKPILFSRPGVPNIWNWLDADYNAYATSVPATAFVVPGPDVDLPGWRQLSSSDTHSAMTTPKYIDASARIADYSASTGGPTTETDYVARLRSRGLGKWGVLNDMQRLFTFYSQEYRPTNLPALGDGPRDFYG